MRKALVTVSTIALAFGAFATIETASAAPKMSKMGCMIGKQKWDATQGKCIDAKPVQHVMHKPKAKAKTM